MNDQSLLLLVWCGTVITCVLTPFMVWVLLSRRGPRTSKHLFWAALLVAVAVIVISCIWHLYHSVVNDEARTETGSNQPTRSSHAEVMPDGSRVKSGWTVWLNSAFVPGATVERQDNQFKIALSYEGRRIHLTGSGNSDGLTGQYVEEGGSSGDFNLFNQQHQTRYTVDLVGFAGFVRGMELRIIFL